ncbi:MAG: glycoside hydrolase family 127 protein [Cytophagales bacterium]|nr:glycoside hydrolase family 127 protein [Cytophagales bacterium]
MRTAFFCLAGLLVASAVLAQDYPIKPVPFTEVTFRSAFWSPRLETNRTVTIPFAFKKCEETGRIDNFAVAGGLKPGKFRGIRYDDSDVFKVIEGAAYSLAIRQDAELDKYLDELIAKIAAAQEPDGYLYTIRTIQKDSIRDPAAGKERWSFLQDSHELYNVGHLYEAAVAHHLATGKKTLLNVATKNADLLADTFGEGKRYAVPGHQEIEIGLVKLYRLTGKKAYLTLAVFFLDQRGRHEHRKQYAATWANPPDYAYYQDHKPVTEQTEAVGHVVRAGYMYSGMADVATLTGNQAYINAIRTLWQNVTNQKMYITGGLGANPHVEGFGPGYDLPNNAYNETCAAIANMLWNQRLFLLTGDAKYIDVLERTLYNGFLSGVSQGGNLFFYPNPLVSNGVSKFNHGYATRCEWFNTSCCPTNVARFLPSLPGYVYAHQKGDIFVNLFIAGTGKVQTDAGLVTLTQQTDYPYSGKVRLAVEPAPNTLPLTLKIRLPGWSDGRPVPGDLYRYTDNASPKISLSVNGKPVAYTTDKGFAVLKRTWKKGDAVELNLPMPVRKVQVNEKVIAVLGKICLERGPLVYCVEAADNGGDVEQIRLTGKTRFQTATRPDLLRGTTVIKGENADKTTFTAIPYHLWSHRGPGEMAVWLPTE